MKNIFQTFFGAKLVIYLLQKILLNFEFFFDKEALNEESKTWFFGVILSFSLLNNQKVMQTS